MNLDDLTLGEIKQLKALLGEGKTCNVPTDHGLQIVVIDRGFVYIGQVRTAAEWCYITNAHNIRIWGTKKGLGELTRGPTKDTVFDPVGNVQAPLRAVISLIAAEESKWTGKF